jgi:hypothetical protein
LIEKAKAGETETLEIDEEDSDEVRYMTLAEFKSGINPILDIIKNPINSILEKKEVEPLTDRELQEILNRVYEVIKPALKYSAIGSKVGNAFSRGNILYKIIALITTIGSVIYPRYKQLKKHKDKAVR